MEKKVICLDTSVLIDYYRKRDKSKSFFYELMQNYSAFSVSAVTAYEIYVGSTEEQDVFWNEFFDKITVLPYDGSVNKIAIKTNRDLKRKNQIISIPDILIGATAIKYNFPFATLNSKHFQRITELQLIEKK